MSKKIKTIEDAKAELEKLIDKIGGSHTHNLVGIVLRIVDEKFGRFEANRLIDEYELDILFGVNKEPYTGVLDNGKQVQYFDEEDGEFFALGAAVLRHPE